MVIGIVGNTEKGKREIQEYLIEKYNVKYYDVDKILNMAFKEEDLNLNMVVNAYDICKLKEKINQIILEKINIQENNIIVLDYQFLFDTVFGDICDVSFRVNNPVNETINLQLDLFKVYQKGVIESNYQNYDFNLTLDLNENWKEKIDNYFNYNFFYNKKVSVVVPIYNTLNYLSKCVDSICKQTYRNLEILLVDDGSTDDSLKLCNYLSKKDSRIKVIHQNNRGLAEARNTGKEKATGEYICFIDSDDYIEKTMIETLLKAIEKTGADVCEGSFYIHFKNGEIRDVSSEQKGIKYIENKLNLINAYSDATILIPAWDKIYRLSSIKKIDFDKNCFKEDTDYIYKLCMSGKTFALVNKPFYHYIKRTKGSITADKISPRLFSLRNWGWDAYKEVLSNGTEYTDAAEKILYNSLVHILRYFMRDYKNNVLEKDEYKKEIHIVVSELLELLLKANNVSKFRKLEEVLSIINELLDNNILDKGMLPEINVPCVGILWNSLNNEMMNEAIEMIRKYASIENVTFVDLEDKYREFINDIYKYEPEFYGIPVLKAGILINRYDSNTIAILNMVIKVSNYIYYNKSKGFILKEISELKELIRRYFKPKIIDYAYDNIFHLTVNEEENNYTKEVCKKYIKS
ncbi:MAG: glycosyltransferase family 2 protein [Bacilli bacterium]|nr:glycosyltransferase family 2 protein [Bacilli bacterium]